jgi:hypothetical protein
MFSETRLFTVNAHGMVCITGMADEDCFSRKGAKARRTFFSWFKSIFTVKIQVFSYLRGSQHVMSRTVYKPSNLKELF